MSSKTNNKNGNFKLYELKIQNIVTTADLKQPIDITISTNFIGEDMI